MLRIYTASRTRPQQAISTLIANMSAFAKSAEGRSDNLIKILNSAKVATDLLMKTQHLYRDVASYGPNLMTSMNRLLWEVGLRKGADLDAKFDVLRANLYRVPEFFERMPGAYPGMQKLLRDSDVHTDCANGQLLIPPMVKVFLTDQQVVLCNR